MNKAVLVVVIAVVVGASLWFMRGGQPQSPAPALPKATEPTVKTPEKTPEKVTLATDNAPTRVVPPSPRETVADAEDPAEVERRRVGALEAGWVASWGTATKAELERLIAKMAPGARDQRESLFEQFAAEPGRAETIWSDFDAEPTAIEQRFPRTGLMAAAHLVERDKPSGKAHFQVIYLTADEAPDLADTERLLAWLAAHAASAEQ